MIVAKLPYRLTHTECNQFLTERIITPLAKSSSGAFTLDFAGATFIDPSGVAALYNALQIISHFDRDIHFTGHELRTEVNVYLDDSGFFETCLPHRVFESRPRRSTTVPLHIFTGNNYYGHLTASLMPWIANSVDMDADSLEVLRATLEEAYHNVTYHSGVRSGCVFAQHYPRRNELEVVVSDHGGGIPAKVRTKVPKATDSEALKLAFQKGFTTGSVVENRGWGLWQLSNYAAQKNGGSISLRSGYGIAEAVRGPNDPHIKATHSHWVYPGTLVRIVLKTDTLKRLGDDTEKEVFSW